MNAQVRYCDGWGAIGFTTPSVIFYVSLHFDLASDLYVDLRRNGDDSHTHQKHNTSAQQPSRAELRP